MKHSNIQMANLAINFQFDGCKARLKGMAWRKVQGIWTHLCERNSLLTDDQRRGDCR